MHNIYNYFKKIVVTSNVQIACSNNSVMLLPVSVTVVNIGGVNLLGYGSNVTTVMFGEQLVNVINVSNNSIFVRINSSMNNTNIEAVNVTIVSNTFAIITSAPITWSFLVEGRVTNVTPTEGQVGTIVTLRGTNLLGNGSNITSVYLDGIATDIMSFNNTQVTVLIGTITQRRIGYVPGEVRIMADTGAIILTAPNVTFNVREAGMITGFTPRIGREGTWINITGINLHAFGTVITNATVAGIPVMANSIQFSISDPNTVMVRAGPSEAVTSGNIELSVNTGPTVRSNTTYNFTYVAPGNITMVTPSSGVEGVGVLITGDDLYIANSSLTNVFLSGAPVARVVASTRSIIAVIAGQPVTTNTSTEVTITASDGSVTRGSSFTYDTPHQLIITPSSGQFGTRVTIMIPPMFNTPGDLSVLVDNVPATIVDSNSTVINISIPQAQGEGLYSVDVLVENSNGELARLPNGFTYIPEGVVTDVTPNSGQQGTIVTVTGHGLLGGGEVIQSATLAGLTTMVMNSSNSTVILQVLNNINSTAPLVGDVTLTADSGAVVRQRRTWTAAVPAIISMIQPSSGQFATIVNISGSNLLQDGLNIRVISLAGIEVYNISSTSSTLISVRASNGTADLSGPVRVELETGAYYESPVNWTYSTPTTISRVFPEIGAAGSTITIELANFTGDNITMVTIDDIPATILDMNNNSVSVTVPTGNHSSQPVAVVVETASGLIVTQDDAFTVEELGNITSVSPLIIQQNIEVTITGENLLGRSNQTAVQDVWLAGIPVNEVIYYNDSVVVVRAGYTPTSVTGNITISLNTSATIVSDLNTTNVSYYQAEIFSISPSRGYNATRFTINGTNLIQPGSSLVSITIGNINARVEQFNYDYIVARAGQPNMTDVNVSMTVSVLSRSGALIELRDGWTYEAIPLITSVEPNVTGVGDNVTIFGLDLPVDNTSTILIGGISVRQVFNFNSTMIEVELSFSVGNSNPQRVEIINSDGTTVTSEPLFSYNNTVDNSVISVTPPAGLNGTVVTIVVNNTIADNGTIVYLADVMASNITLVTSNTTNATTTTIYVTAGYGDNVTGDVFILTSNGMIGLQDGWRYLPVLNGSYVTPGRGQQGTMVTITVGPSLLTAFNITTVTLAGVNATILNITDTAVVVEAGQMMDPTNISDVVLNFQENVTLPIPQSWLYLTPMNITMVSNNAMGYYGSRVTIYGENFLNGRSPDSVNITEVILANSSVTVTIIYYNDTIIMCNISQFINSSQASIVGPIVVRNSLGFSDNTSGTLNFTYVQVNVTSVSPSRGQNGTMVTIQGVGLLAGATEVVTLWLDSVPVRSIITANDSVIVVQADYSNMSTPLGNITYLTNTGAMVTAPQTWYYVAPAMVSSVTPSNGSQGTTVTIRGTQLLAGSDSVDAVYLDGVAASTVVIAFNTVIQVTAGYRNSSITDTIPGPVSVRLSTGAVWTATNARFTYVQPGTITMVTPLQGQNGTVINITGTSLYPLGDNVASVTLAGVSARVVSTGNTFIQVIAGRPATLESFSGPVIVQATSGSFLRYANNFTYLQEGIIFSVTPSQGQNGTRVRIEGENLLGGGSMLDVVWLAGRPANIDVANSNNTSVMVTATENPYSFNETISGDVLLISNTGAHVRRIDGWQYIQRGVIDDITPASGQYGTRIVIRGMRILSGAAGVSQVTIGDVAVNNVSANDSVITGRAGNPGNTSAFNGTVRIISSDGGVLMSNYTWSYNQGGEIGNFTPTSGGNNEIVSITGTNLLGSGSSINVTIANIPVTNIISQNNTLVIVVSGVVEVQGNFSGPIILTADTGAIVTSTVNYDFISPCNLNQFINGTFGGISCADCNSLCASCVGPTDSDCLQCSSTAFALGQVTVNNTIQCTDQCASKFATEDRRCVGSCEAGQYESFSVSENTTFCLSCHEQCAPNTSCSGPARTQCEQCRLFTYQSACIETCPSNTFANQNNTCLQCHSQCIGCTGPTASECINCRNFSLTENVTNTCVIECPLNHYVDNLTCLPCDPQCLSGCRDSSPLSCTQCRSAGVLRSDGRTECVSDCNFSVNNTYYLDANGTCKRCSELCSNVDGCTGPTSSDCRSCRNGTYRLNNDTDTCIRDCAQLEGMNDGTIRYYNDDITRVCGLCDASCGSRGCTERPSNCVATGRSDDNETGAFEAGAGTIGIVIAVCVLLLLLLLLCIVVFFIQRNKVKGKYSYPQVATDPSDTEMNSRYAVFKESQETDFNRSSATNTSKPPKEVPTADETYTDMSGTEDTLKKPLTKSKQPEIVELYIGVPQEGEMYTDMTVANQDVGGEEYIDVPSPGANVITNPGYDEGGEAVYEDTDQAVESAKAYVRLQKKESPAPPPSLPPSRSKPSIPTPSNPLQESMSRLVTQPQQDNIYDDAPIEEQLYDAIGMGMPPEPPPPFKPKPPITSKPASNVLPLPPK